MQDPPRRPKFSIQSWTAIATAVKLINGVRTPIYSIQYEWSVVNGKYSSHLVYITTLEWITKRLIQGSKVKYNSGKYEVL